MDGFSLFDCTLEQNKRETIKSSSNWEATILAIPCLLPPSSDKYLPVLNWSSCWRSGPLPGQSLAHTCSVNNHQHLDVPWLRMQELAVILFNCWQSLDHIPIFLHLAELSACITIYRGHRFDHLDIDVKLRHFPVAASGFSTKSNVFAALGLLYGRATDALSRLPDLLALLSFDSSLTP